MSFRSIKLPSPSTVIGKRGGVRGTAKGDALGLATDTSLVAYIQKVGAADEYIAFSKNVEAMQDDGTWKTCTFVMTDHAVYSFSDVKIRKLHRTIPFAKISSVTCSKVSPEVLFHIEEEDDFYFKMFGQDKMISTLTRLYDNMLRKEVEVEYVWKLTLTQTAKMKARVSERIVPSRMREWVMKRQNVEDENAAEFSKDDGSGDEAAEGEEEEKYEPTEARSPGSEKLTLDDFDLMKVLGQGSFAKVIQVRRKDTGVIYALKVLKKQRLSTKKHVAYTFTEKEILQTCAHPCIVKLHGAFQTSKKLYLVLDFHIGGELFFHLKKKRKFSEGESRTMVAQIAAAIGFLHSKGYLYRDLKPENILMDADGNCYLSDFGLAKRLEFDGTTKSMCGTPEYLPPEVHEGKEYGRSVDWWALGVLLFELVTGLSPFASDNMAIMTSKIMYAEVGFPPEVSASCKDLISKLLAKDASTRLGTIKDSEEILNHKFFKEEGIVLEKILKKELKPLYKPEKGSSEELVNFDEAFTSVVASVDDNSSGFLSKIGLKGKEFTDWTYVSKAPSAIAEDGTTEEDIFSGRGRYTKV